jgi:DNA primase
VPGRIRSEDIEALRERADLSAVVSDYTTLKRAGSRLKGLCPFHQEKTPSFVVEPGRGLFHCFGCNAGGDVYAFLQRIEALTFPEAVERLARATGFELQYEELTPGQRRSLGRRTRLAEALGEAAAFYQECLAGTDGAAARRYLTGRGVDAEGAGRFRLGWAPDSWDVLFRHLVRRGFEPQEMLDAGLATPGRDGPIDRFRGRLLFPILDPSGRDVLGFGGRVLPARPLKTAPREGQPPKYINSPETELYKKSRVLYGLNWARGEIQRHDETVLVVEGYMDVIGLHLAGVRNVVATCGTALTEEHFRQLEKFARRVVLALDADDAGFAAADRARALAQQVGVREIAVLPLPVGQDPADLAASGQQAVQSALATVRSAVEYQIQHVLRVADTSTLEGQVDAYRRTFPLLARIDDRFLRFTYIRDVVGPTVRLSADLIEAELDRHIAAGGTEEPRQGDAEATTPPRPTGGSAPRPSAPGELAGPAAPRDPQLRLERDVLQLALQHPELLPAEWKLVAVGDFRAPASQQLFAALVEAPPGDLDAVLLRLPDDDARARVRALALSETTVESDPGHVQELVARLRAAAVQRQIDAVGERMARLGEQMSRDERRELAADHLELVRRRRAILEARGD